MLPRYWYARGVAKQPEPDLALDEARDLIEFWLVSLRGSKADGTVTAYERGVRQFLDYCEAQGHAEPIQRRVLAAWLAHLRQVQKMQGYTARSRLTAVRQFARWLIAEGEIEHNPFRDVEMPSVDEKLVEPLTDEQIGAMLAACEVPKGASRERRFIDIRDAALLHVMVEKGMRAGEVLSLTMADVKWSEVPPTLTVRKTKTRRGRVVPLSPEAANRLSRYVRERRKMKNADHDAFWLSARRDVLTYHGLYDALDKRARWAGVADFHPHRMRHTAAHRWLSKGGSEGGLMAVAGWQSPQMLMRYTRAQASQRAAEEAKRLNLGEL